VVTETHFTAVPAQNRRYVQNVRYRRDRNFDRNFDRYDRNDRRVVVYRNDACVR